MKNYNATNKKAFVHRANRNRTSESDVPDKFRVMKYLKEHFDLITVTDEVVPIPAGYATQRLPDLAIPSKNIAILLHGGIHGTGDEVSRRDKDIRALQDYNKTGWLVIEVYAELTENYSEIEVVKHFEGLGYVDKLMCRKHLHGALNHNCYCFDDGVTLP